MAVQWGLAAQPVNPLQALQAFGMAQQQRAQQEELQRQRQMQERQLAARQQASQQLGAGDYRGATQTALASGDLDLAKQIGGLSEDNRKRLAQQSEIIGRVSYGLRQVPMAERQAALSSYLPALQAQGIDPQEVDWTDLSDTGLDGRINTAMTLDKAIAASLDQARFRSQEADRLADNKRQEMLANNTIATSNERLNLARAADARSAEARSEGRVRFRERDKDRAAIAAGGRGVRTDLSDLDY